jgi:hypothetical protein
LLYNREARAAVGAHVLVGIGRDVAVGVGAGQHVVVGIVGGAAGGAQPIGALCGLARPVQGVGGRQRPAGARAVHHLGRAPVVADERRVRGGGAGLAQRARDRTGQADQAPGDVVVQRPGARGLRVGRGDADELRAAVAAGGGQGVGGARPARQRGQLPAAIVRERSPS